MIVFDSGALIVLERRKQRAIRIWSTALRDELEIFVPGVTSDVDDLEELRSFFPGVRVLSV